MAQQMTITQKCGHTTERYLHGRTARITAQVRVLENNNCHKCILCPADVKTATASSSSAQRKLVKLGSVSVGDTLNGKIVTGLGRHWFCNSADDGMTDPWLDGQYVQYAYSD